MKPVGAAARDEGAELARVAARGEHDLGVHVVAADLRSDVEPVEVREVDVEQDDVGVQVARGLQAVAPSIALADDVEAVVLEQQARCGSEARVIVDDEDLRGHI